MKEKLISLETAKLAKEKGFVNDSEKAYDNLGDIKNVFCISLSGNNLHPHIFEAPTQSLLQKWLREVHSKEILIFCLVEELGNTITKRYVFWTNINDYFPSSDSTKYLTYEEALEEALLKNLTEIVKNEQNDRTRI